MRKSLVAILLLAVVAVLFLLLRPSSQPSGQKPGEPGASENTSETTHDSATATRPRWTKPTRNEAVREETPTSKAVVYGASDFSRGELQNIVIDDGIKLGNDTSFVPRFNPKFRMFGNYISPEIDSTQPFDALSLNLQASALGENEVIFEVRTRSRFNEWSEWREVSPETMKEPMTAEAGQSTGYQFRVALFANDPTGSPKVETISIEPISTRPQNFSANNNTN